MCHAKIIELIKDFFFLQEFTRNFSFHYLRVWFRASVHIHNLRMVLTKRHRNTRDNCCPFNSLVFCFQSTLSYIKRTSSLEAYIEWFNRLSYLVATEICLVSRQKTDFR